MANNKSIRILRGTTSSIVSHKNDTLEPGQLLYNMDNGYLTCGSQDSTGQGNTTMSSQPITVRQVIGYFEDNTSIVDNKSMLYGIAPTDTSLQMQSTRDISIHSDGDITMNKPPILEYAPEYTASDSHVVSANWVRNCTGDIKANTTGNAATATKLKDPVTITLRDGATGTAQFDGASDIEISVSAIDPGVISSGTIHASITGNAAAATVSTKANAINISGKYYKLTYSNGILSYTEV